jgi:hypothetical protein
VHADAEDRLPAGSLSRPDDLVQLHALDVGVDLHPQRKVIGHLEGKRGLPESLSASE